jgi:hypothetical protein
MYKRWLCAALLAHLTILPVAAHEQTESWQTAALPAGQSLRIPAREVELTEAEQEAGVISYSQFLPALAEVNQQYRVYQPRDYQYFVQNFHYPFRQRFFLEHTPPPTQVVLHWTANRRTDIPLYTLSAFMRRGQGGRVVERPDRYKNVSNYFLSGHLRGAEGSLEPQLIKLTRGDLRNWGDIPRVTAYPTGESDDNKYDGRGALGIEIESPNFGTFYRNQAQRDKLHNFLLLVLQERGVLEDFVRLRESPQWENLRKLHAYLQENLDSLDVQPNGSIPRPAQLLHLVARNLPECTPETLSEARRIFAFISGHGVVAHEYNNRMVRAGRFKDADYDKIDFTEPHVFLVALDLLQSELRYRGTGSEAYDLATLRLIEAQRQQQRVPPTPELTRSDLPLTLRPESADGPPMLFYQPHQAWLLETASHEPH